MRKWPSRPLTTVRYTMISQPFALVEPERPLEDQRQRDDGDGRHDGHAGEVLERGQLLAGGLGEHEVGRPRHERAHRQHVAVEAVGASAVATEHHDRRARHRHRAPDHLGAPRPLAEQRTGDREHEHAAGGRRSRWRWRCSSPAPRTKKRTRSAVNVSPPASDSAQEPLRQIRPPVARKTTVTMAAPEPDPVAGHARAR